MERLLAHFKEKILEEPKQIRLGKQPRTAGYTQNVYRKTMARQMSVFSPFNRSNNITPEDLKHFKHYC